jgi:hypothetical protein
MLAGLYLDLQCPRGPKLHRQRSQHALSSTIRKPSGSARAFIHSASDTRPRCAVLVGVSLSATLEWGYVREGTLFKLSCPATLASIGGLAFTARRRAARASDQPLCTSETIEPSSPTPVPIKMNPSAT